MTKYNDYKRDFVRSWAQTISVRAGCEPGKGGRGKKDSPLRRLTEKLRVDYGTWLRYKAGTQMPNPAQMQRIHQRATELGLLGRETRGVGFLKAVQERYGIPLEDEWAFWQRYEANPAFQVEEQEEALRERLAKLEREAAAIRRFLALS